MHKLFYLTIFFVVSTAILYYLGAEVLSPYDDKNVLVFENLITMSVLLALSAGSLIALIHAGIDKLFFLKFYQKPRILMSLRRGLIISLASVVCLDLKIIGFGDTQYYLLIATLALLFEAFFVFLGLNRNPKKEAMKTEVKM